MCGDGISPLHVLVVVGTGREGEGRVEGEEGGYDEVYEQVFF